MATPALFSSTSSSLRRGRRDMASESRRPQSAPLLTAEDKSLYKGEKEPEDKAAAVDGPATLGKAIQHIEAVQSPVAAPEERKWSTGLFECCPLKDGPWTSTDCEICVLGTFAPCILYGATKERLEPGLQTFTSECFLYASLCILGKFLVHGFLAPCFTYTTRSAVRRTYNLEGPSTNLNFVTSCLFGASVDSRETADCVFDWAIHYFCHPCALCQEAREVRRSEVSHLAHHPTSRLLAPNVQEMRQKE